MKAMVLAAGKATRLRPLTDRIAKPAVSFVGVSMLDRVLDGLAAAGVDHAVVNVHHAPETVRALVARRGERMPRITFSDETAELLGTGGALVPVRELFADAPFLLVNGDCVHEVDYAAVLRDHERTGSDATLAVRPSGERGFGALVVDAQGHFVAFGEPSTGRPSERHFLSVQVLSPRVLEHLPSSPRSFGSFDAWYPRARAAGCTFTAFESLAEWHALDSRELYLAAQADYLSRRGGRSFVDPGSRVEGRLDDASAVHRGARVARTADVSGSALLENAVVEDGAVVVDSILAPGARVAAGVRVERTIVAGTP